MQDEEHYGGQPEEVEEKEDLVLGSTNRLERLSVLQKKMYINILFNKKNKKGTFDKYVLVCIYTHSDMISNHIQSDL